MPVPGYLDDDHPSLSSDEFKKALVFYDDKFTAKLCIPAAQREIMRVFIFSAPNCLNAFLKDVSSFLSVT